MAKSAGGAGRSGRGRAVVPVSQGGLAAMMRERVAARAGLPQSRFVDVRSNLLFQPRTNFRGQNESRLFLTGNSALDKRNQKLLQRKAREVVAEFDLR